MRIVLEVCNAADLRIVLEHLLLEARGHLLEGASVDLDNVVKNHKHVDRHHLEHCPHKVNKLRRVVLGNACQIVATYLRTRVVSEHEKQGLCGEENLWEDKSKKSHLIYADEREVEDRGEFEKCCAEEQHRKGISLDEGVHHGHIVLHQARGKGKVGDCGEGNQEVLWGRRGWGGVIQARVR